MNRGVVVAVVMVFLAMLSVSSVSALNLTADATGASFPNQAGGWTTYSGMKFTALVNSTLFSATMGTGGDATRAYLMDASHNVIENVSTSGLVANFSGTSQLVAGTTYYIQFGSDGAGYTAIYDNTGFSGFPITGTNVEYTAYYDGTSDNTNRNAMMLASLTTNTEGLPVQNKTTESLGITMISAGSVTDGGGWTLSASENITGFTINLYSGASPTVFRMYNGSSGGGTLLETSTCNATACVFSTPWVAGTQYRFVGDGNGSAVDRYYKSTASIGVPNTTGVITWVTGQYTGAGEPPADNSNVGNFESVSYDELPSPPAPGSDVYAVGFDGATTVFNGTNDNLAYPVVEKLGSFRIDWTGTGLNWSGANLTQYVTYAEPMNMVFREGAEVGLASDNWYMGGNGGLATFTAEKSRTGKKSLKVNNSFVNVQASRNTTLLNKTFDWWMWDDMTPYAGAGESLAVGCMGDYGGPVETSQLCVGYNPYENTTAYLIEVSAGPPMLFAGTRSLGWHHFQMYMNPTGTQIQAYVDGQAFTPVAVTENGFAKRVGIVSYSTAENTHNQTYADDMIVYSGPPIADVTRWVSVDSSNLPADVNGSANVSFSVSGYANPRLYEDGVLCESCSLVSNNGSVLKFSVSHFTNYSLEDVPGPVNYTLTVTMNSTTPFLDSMQNVTVDATGATWANSAPGWTSPSGMKFVALNNVSALEIGIGAGSTATRAYLTDASHNVLQNVSIVGSTATISYNITAGTTYYVKAGSDGASFTAIYDNTGFSGYPMTGGNIEFTAYYDGSSDATNRQGMMIDNVTTSTDFEGYTSTVTSFCADIGAGSTCTSTGTLTFAEVYNGTYNLSYTSSTHENSSVNITLAGDTSYIIQATPNYVPPVVNYSLTDGLTAYFDADGASCLENRVGGVNLTATGSPVCSTGLLGDGFVMSGNNVDYFTASLPVSHLPNNDKSRSLCFWVEPSDLSDYHHFVNWGAGAPSGTFGVYSGATTDANFYGFTDDAAFSTVLNTSSYHFLCVEYNGSVVEMYHNGVNVANASKVLNTGLGALRFGVSADVNAAYTGVGVLDGVGVWNRTLGQSEIIELYNGGVGLGFNGSDFGAYVPSPVNFTSHYYDIHPSVLSNSASSQACGGVKFTMNETYNLTGVSRYATDTADKWYIYNGSRNSGTNDCLGGSGGTLIANGTFGGGNLAESIPGGVMYNVGETWSYLTNSLGGSYNMKYDGCAETPALGNTSRVNYTSGHGNGVDDQCIRNVAGLLFSGAGSSPPPAPLVNYTLTVQMNDTNTSSFVNVFCADIGGSPVCTSNNTLYFAEIYNGTYNLSWTSSTMQNSSVNVTLAGDTTYIIQAVPNPPPTPPPSAPPGGYFDVHGQTLTNTGSTVGISHQHLNTTVGINVTGVYSSYVANGDECYVYSLQPTSSSSAPLASTYNGTFSSGVCTLGVPLQVVSGGNFWTGIGKTGGSYSYAFDTFGSPTVGNTTYLTYIDGYFNTPTNPNLIATVSGIYFNVGGEPPVATSLTYQNVSHSRELAGDYSTFGVLLRSTNVTLNSCTFSFDNGNGVFVNDTARVLSGSSQWCNVSKRLNATSGVTVQYKWYFNASSGLENETSVYSFTTIASVLNETVASWSFDSGFDDVRSGAHNLSCVGGPGPCPVTNGTNYKLGNGSVTLFGSDGSVANNMLTDGVVIIPESKSFSGWYYPVQEAQVLPGEHLQTYFALSIDDTTMSWGAFGWDSLGRGLSGGDGRIIGMVTTGAHGQYQEWVSYPNDTLSANLSLNAWHFIALVQYRNETPMLYVDGNVINIYQSNTGGSDLDPTGRSALLRVGGEGTYMTFNGSIDDVNYWDRLLSVDELNQIYSAGLGNAYPFNGPVVPLVNYTLTVQMNSTNNNTLVDSFCADIGGSPICTSNNTLYFTELYNGTYNLSYTSSTHENSSVNITLAGDTSYTIQATPNYVPPLVNYTLTVEMNDTNTSTPVNTFCADIGGSPSCTSNGSIYFTELYNGTLNLSYTSSTHENSSVNITLAGDTTYVIQTTPNPEPLVNYTLTLQMNDTVTSSAVSTFCANAACTTNGTAYLSEVYNGTLSVAFTSSTHQNGTVNVTVAGDTTYVFQATPLAASVSNLSCAVLTSPNELDLPSAATVPVYFTVTSPSGFASASRQASLTKSGNVYQASSCAETNVSSTVRAYTCQVPLNFYREAGFYAANISGQAKSGLPFSGSIGSVCEFAELLAMQQNIQTIAFPTAAPGVTDAQADNPVVIRNTGNANLNVSIKAFNLTGRQLSQYGLLASSFKSGLSLGSAVSLANNVTTPLGVNIAPAAMSNESVRFWLTMSPSATAQQYYSATPWQVVVTG